MMRNYILLLSVLFSSLSIQAQLSVNIESSKAVLCEGASLSLFLKIVGGTLPYTVEWNTGATTESISINSASVYSVVVTDKDNNKAYDTINVKPYQSFASQIDVITKSWPSLTNNIIAWQRLVGKGIQSYKLQRSSQDGSFETITEQAFSSLPVFVDSFVDISKITRYRLVTIDSVCQAESISDVRSSIYLTSISLPNETKQLAWNAFASNKSAVYYIYKLNSDKSSLLIDSVESGSDYVSYNLKNSSVYDVYYVAYKLPVIINPTLLKSDIGPFGLLYSNMTEAQIAPSLTIKKQISDTSILFGKISSKYRFADYFILQDNANTTYQVYSNSSAVYPIVMNDYFGFLTESEGTAIVTVRSISKNGIAEQKFSVSVTASSCAINVQPTITNNTCASACSGAISLSVSGGTEPYQYRWSNTRTDNKISNLASGQYSVIITDANACALKKSFVVSSPSAIFIRVNQSNPTCKQANGSLSLSVDGGTAPYAYNWSDGASQASVFNKLAGVYTVTVSDSKACTLVQSIALSDMLSPTIQINEIKASTCNPNDGGISVSVSGGTGATSYIWNDGVQTKDRKNIAVGNYSLTVTDENACKATSVVFVPAVAVPQPEIALVTVSNQKNLVVWLKDSTSAIDFYTVYREANNSGIFDSVGMIKYKDVSIFEDAQANSLSQSWRYRLTATSYCGVKSAMSSAKAEFKTMHLQVTPNVNFVELKWDAYEGLQFLEYIIYRSIEGGQPVELARVSADVTNYIDANPLTGVKSVYSVVVVLPKEINPSKFKTSQLFSQSSSNTEQVQILSRSSGVNNCLTIYPQPAKQQITIRISDNDGCLVRLLTSNGMLLNQTILHNGEAQFDVSKLSKGLYVIQIHANAGCVSRIIEIE